MRVKRGIKKDMMKLSKDFLATAPKAWCIKDGQIGPPQN